MKLKSCIALIFLGLVVITAGSSEVPYTVSYSAISQVAPPLPPPPSQDRRQAVEFINQEYLVYVPFTLYQSGPLIDPWDRSASRSFFLEQYWAYRDPVFTWTGSKSACDPGSVNPEYREATRARINYFRAMAGVPAGVRFDDEYTRKAQAAALMMSVNDSLSHDPPASWKCYSQDGDEGAGSSNLCLGCSGPFAITAYMEDYGGNNYPVGHRRWILYPQTKWMGSGDIPGGNGGSEANALWVFDDNIWSTRPDTREPFVAWPPPGYVPDRVVYARWSISYPDADFSSATVTMDQGGVNVTVNVQPVYDGYGENTLVWEPSSLVDPAPGKDVVYNLTVSNVWIDGENQEFNYQVIVFDPFD